MVKKIDKPEVRVHFKCSECPCEEIKYISDHSDEVWEKILYWWSNHNCLKREVPQAGV
jgi:hypothetical protein